MCMSARHCGAGASSPQYSSMEAIFPAFIFIKEVTWHEMSPSYE